MHQTVDLIFILKNKRVGLQELSYLKNRRVGLYHSFYATYS